VERLLAEDEDVHWMRRALDEAIRGRGRAEPNPLVGSVVTRNGELVGVGYHEQFGGPHAEVMALQNAGPAAAGATLYVTLEPCCHYGKTPPCTQAILAAGISRVVVAMRDPFPQVSGRGLETLRAAGLDVETGCLANRARLLNAPYLKRLVTGLPFVTAKWAMTIDGKTAVRSGDSQWISSERSRSLVHELRGRMDAILVGIGTIEADDPLLTARPPGPRCPIRVILDSQAQVPLTSRLIQTARDVPVMVAVTDRASPTRRDRLIRLGCEIAAFPGSGRVPIVPLLEELGRRGMTHLLVEGGARALGSFLDEGQVDAVDVFIAPIVEGGDHPHTAARGKGFVWMKDASRLKEVDVTQVDCDVRIRGTVPQVWQSLAGFGSD
jgi:diaminohydroxyphosphoribosylaminopyrimidine deaminase / 5-amino-6-(5-phosphoribosylamino)uracil reductase